MRLDHDPTGEADDWRPALDALGAAEGSALADPEPPHWTVASADAIRHFARSYGDDNPLYCDPDYARASPRGPVAPPLFPLSSGIPANPPAGSGAPPGPFPGHPDAGIDHEEWVLHRPVAVGTCLVRQRHLVQVGPVTGGAGPVASYTVTERTTYADAGVLVATRDRRRRYWLGPAPARAVPDRAAYSPSQLAEIDAAYAAETRRGSVPRTADAVRPGERLGPMVKGPLTVTDLVEYRAGVGGGPLGGDALRLAYHNRRRRPGVYELDDHGVYDTVERRHWDDAYARTLGLPGAYDYSHTRLVWLSHLLTDWMGDGGHLQRLSGTTALGANYVGDTHWLTGRVRARRAGAVVVELTATNQRGEVTCRADAVVLLPRRGEVAVNDADLSAGGRS